ncbi:MAG TPA: ATP-binding protein [Syntrophomonadaceae bacterium]|nr:ATP-binding protein [Syntrophomonadaceae bacterium]HRX21644.1 ATP-binding protein [Syntrophomonadaceae bacterium]
MSKREKSAGTKSNNTYQPQFPLDDEHIMESIAAAVIVTDAEGNVHGFNKAAEEMFGIPKQKAMGTKYYLKMAPKEEERMQLRFNHVLKTGKPFYGQDESFSMRDGRQVTLNLHISVLRDKEGNHIGIIMLVEDVTKKRLSERVMQRKEKLTAVGELAVGIAHELRNPLSSIKGFARIMQNDLAPDHGSQQYLEIIIKEVDRIIRLSHELLSTALNPDKNPYFALQINDVVEQSVEDFKMENYLAQAYVKLQTEPDLPLIWGEPERLKQVMMNLLHNAYQALDNSGYIYVDTSREDEWVKIAVTDTGSGIEADKIDRIFDPFFTTKLEGNGLGLALVHSIVSQHHGFIEVRSEPAQGATFIIRLPIREKVQKHE